MEIEFLAQTGVLYNDLACRAAGEALPALAANGWIGEDEAAALAEALALMLRLQQIERVALETPIDPKTAGEGLRRAMARACGAEDFAALESRLATLQRAAAEIGERLFQEH
jgi:glutamine synthetase adenylyltransferase